MNRVRDIGVFALIVVGLGFWLTRQKGDGAPFRISTVKKAEKLSGLQFGSADRKLMMEDITSNLESYESIRDLKIPNSVQPQFSLIRHPLALSLTRLDVQYDGVPSGKFQDRTILKNWHLLL